MQPTASPQPHSQPKTHRGLTYALWVNAILLVVIAMALLTRSNASLIPVASAQNTPPIAGGAGVFIMPAQLGRDLWGTYLLDVDNQTIATYAYRSNDRQLQLLAARTYRFDRRLENFNTSTPSPEEVEQLVQRQSRLRAGLPAVPPSTQPSEN